MELDLQFLAGFDPVPAGDGEAHAAARDVDDADDAAARSCRVPADVGPGQAGGFAEVAAEIEQHVVDVAATAANRERVPVVAELGHGHLAHQAAAGADEGGAVAVTDVDGEGLCGHQS